MGLQKSAMAREGLRRQGGAFEDGGGEKAVRQRDGEGDTERRNSRREGEAIFVDGMEAMNEITGTHERSVVLSISYCTLRYPA